MKTTYIIISILLSACTFSLNNKDHADTSGQEYTAAYICPMHCKGSGSDTAGNCPVCNMKYEQNPDHKLDDHNNHTTEYSCPMHPEITGIEGDSCSICGMALDSTIKK